MDDDGDDEDDDDNDDEDEDEDVDHDDGEDEDDDDDDGDDDDDDDGDDEMKMMKWMLRRRRKMMTWRGRMLRRKTDPKTRKHTLCEPAQSKRTWTFHKSHFVWKLTAKMPDPNPATHVFCASLCSRNAHGQVTRAILRGILQEKCRTHMRTPQFNTEPYLLP